MIFGSFDFQEESVPHEIFYRDFQIVDFELLNNKLNEINFDEIFESRNINDKVEMTNNCILDLFDACVPLKKI